MLKNWLKIFLYNSLHNRLFFMLTVFGLALGMTGVILSLLYWEEENAYNQWNPNKDNIAEVIINLRENTWQWNVAPLGENLLANSDKVERYLYFTPNYLGDPIKYEGKLHFVNKYINAQSTFFDFFPFDVIKGSAQQFKSTPAAIALEENQVKGIFGDVDPIGKTVSSTTGRIYTVTTVYKLNKSTSIKPNLVTNVLDETIKQGIKNNNWGDFNYGLLLKLKNPNDKELVEKQLYDVFYTKRLPEIAKIWGVSEKEAEQQYGKVSFDLVSLADSRLKSSKLPTPLAEGKGNLTFLSINIGLSLLILLISIFNYINLSTAYAVKRAKEIGIRKVIGASKRDVITQQIVETVITTFVAIIISFALVELLLPYYNTLLRKELQVNFLYYAPHFLTLIVLVVLFAGVFPALYIAKFEILKVLKGNFSRSKSGILLRNTMIILQFCIATFFIISGIIITQQVKYAMDKDLGFTAEQVISVGWDKKYDHKFQKYEQIKQELLKIPGVTDVNTSTFTMGLGSSSSSSFQYKGKTIQSQNMATDFGFLDLLGIKLIAGRGLDSKLASDSMSSILLNKTAIDMMGEKDPIEKEFDWNGKKVKIVGIVDDFHLLGLDNKIPPMAFFHIKSFDWMETTISSITVKVKPDHLTETIGQIESYWVKNVDNERPFNYDFLDKIFARTYQDFVNQRNLFGILNIVVISIALLGLFALASYTIERRYKEIAIKKVLGVNTIKLIINLTKQYLVLLIIGYFLALFPSYYLMQLWLNNFVYRIDIPFYAYLTALLLMLLLTIIVVVSKAYAATKISALKYLKYE